MTMETYRIDRRGTTQDRVIQEEILPHVCFDMELQKGRIISVNYYNLLDMATDMGVFVDVDDVGWLSAGHKGGWFPDYDLILLRGGLSYVGQLCTLAHELGHAARGHVGGATGWFSVRQERQADEYAVELLINPVEYRLAEELYGGHTGAIAAELGVTVHVLNTWRKLQGVSRVFQLDT